MPFVSKPVFAVANLLFEHCYPLYKASYYTLKRNRDAFEISVLKTLMKPGDTVLDIGANIGFYAEILSGIVGRGGQVHAFEPDPVNFAHLRRSCDGMANVVLINSAIGNHVGEVDLFRSRLGNVDHRTYPTSDADSSFSVRIDTVDHYLSGRPVAFIKMDIQGAEFFALQGMSGTLDANHDVIVLSEFWPFALKESGTSVDVVQRFVEEKGFLVYRIGEDRLERMTDLAEYFYRPKAKYDDLNLLFSRNPL